MTAQMGEDGLSIVDGQLVRLLDGELSEDERVRLLARMESDEQLRARYEELSAAASELTALLEAVPEPEPPAVDLPTEVEATERRTSWVWQAAAALALLAGVGLTVEPVRAWLVEGMERVVQALAPPNQEAETDAAPNPSEPASPSTVTFRAAEGPVFTVEVDRRQQAGLLLVEQAPVRQQVTASVVDGDGETLVVLPGGLRIANSQDSVTDYRLSVPVDIESVEVRVGGEVVAVLETGEGVSSWVVDLNAKR